jgi:hypothetical protein
VDALLLSGTSVQRIQVASALAGPLTFSCLYFKAGKKRANCRFPLGLVLQ